MQNTLFAKSKAAQRTLGAAAALALLGATAGGALADPPVTMAPPIDPAGPVYSTPGDDGGFSGADGSVAAPIAPPVTTAAEASSSVFNWKEVPENQKVPLTRAVFDRGGYQLYDTVGETIVVPFVNNNLYVMKFAVSPDGTTYFVNTGSAPVLYCPRGYYLENAAVPGSRWYPFTEKFHPVEPVFLGIAPSYDVFIDAGWYPGAFFYGGYFGYSPFVFGVSVFEPTFGLTIFFGGHHYYGWGPYENFYRFHGGYERIGYYNRGYYREAGHFNAGRIGDFRGAGAGRYAFGHGVAGGGGRIFNGAGHPMYAHRTGGSFGGGEHTFATNRATGGSFGGGHTFRGAGVSAGHYSGGSFGGRSYTSSGSHSFGGGLSGSARPAFQGGHAFGGGSASSYHGGGGHGGGFSSHVSGGGGHGGGGNRH